MEDPYSSAGYNDLKFPVAIENRIDKKAEMAIICPFFLRDKGLRYFVTSLSDLMFEKSFFKGGSLKGFLIRLENRLNHPSSLLSFETCFWVTSPLCSCIMKWGA